MPAPSCAFGALGLLARGRVRHRSVQPLQLLQVATEVCQRGQAQHADVGGLEVAVDHLLHALVALGRHLPIDVQQRELRAERGLRQKLCALGLCPSLQLDGLGLGLRLDAYGLGFGLGPGHSGRSLGSGGHLRGDLLRLRLGLRRAHQRCILRLGLGPQGGCLCLSTDLSHGSQALLLPGRDLRLAIKVRQLVLRLRSRQRLHRNVVHELLVHDAEGLNPDVCHFDAVARHEVVVQLAQELVMGLLEEQRRARRV
mmetsp:Transcript_1633/g.4884  ORF Transcript_1633/g.4884 Transcript_1633/m.4884 type:complete len:255 (+) Transcript_1633:70-834(+)